MTDWVVFGTGTPGSPNETDGPIALSTGFLINDAGTYWCLGIEIFVSSVAPTGVEVALWERVNDATPGALLASIAAGALTPGVRNQVLFGTPVQVTAALFPNGMYATYHTANRYTATGGYFQTGPGATDEISGPITAWRHAGIIGSNGRFKVGSTGAADSYPNNHFNGGGYWVTPIITDVDPGGATDLNLTDIPGSLSLAGSPDTLVQDLVLVDRSGPAAAGGSGDTLAAVLADQPGPALLGGSPETLIRDQLWTDRSGSAFPGGTPDSLVQGAAEPLDLTDPASGGVLAGSSQDVLVIAEASGDTSVFPVVLAALACLESAADTLPSPPKYRSIRTGTGLIAAISKTEDECCEGLAWVRVVSISPTNTFPQPEGQFGGCPPPELAVELELGVIRCAPVMNGGGDEFLIPTTAQHLAAAQAVMNDAAALRTAACCLGETRPVVVGTWSPVPTETNCMGGTLRVTVAAPFCERTC